MQPIKRCSLQNWWIHESWKVHEKDKGRHTSNEFDESTVSDCYFLLTDWLITLFCRASRSQIFVVVFVTTEFRGYIIKTECVAAKWDLGRRINAELCLPALGTFYGRRALRYDYVSVEKPEGKWQCHSFILEKIKFFLCAWAVLRNKIVCNIALPYNLLKTYCLWGRWKQNDTCPFYFAVSSTGLKIFIIL